MKGDFMAWKIVGYSEVKEICLRTKCVTSYDKMDNKVANN